MSIAPAMSQRPAFTITPRKRCTGSDARPACRNKQARRPGGKSYGAKCHACRAAIWRKNSPVRAAYNRQRAHAKERGIEFRISFEHWRAFALKSELIGNQGQTAESLTVDRRNNLKGYVVGNLQVMTRAANSAKLAKEDEIRMKKGFAWAE